MAPSLGWWPDPEDARDFTYGAPANSLDPPSHSLRFKTGGHLLDQRPTQGCVGAALAYAALGLGLPVLSRAFIYYASRARHHGQNSDAGTYVRDAVKALNRVGAPIEADWPFDSSNVNAQPSWSVFQRARLFRSVMVYRRVRVAPGQRASAMRNAIANGHPVLIGTGVSQRFISDRTGGLQRPPPVVSEDQVGGHCMCLLEYAPGRFRGPQSWGPRAHGQGWVELADEYIEWEGTRDLWVVSLKPPFS